jgi:hypothetical protein
VLIELLLAVSLLYHTYPRFKRENGQASLFITFLVLLVYLLSHIYNIGLDALLIPRLRSELLEVVCHAARTLFFIIFAFVVLDALISDRLLKRIVKANTLIVISLVLLFTLGMLVLEDGELLFYYTDKEFIYELSEITANILLISISYFAWMDTRSRGMLFILIAFILFFISNLHHISALLWARSYAAVEIIEPLVKDFFSMLAVAFLAYSHRLSK